MPHIPSFASALGLALLLGLAPPGARADAGHDHGDAAAAPTGGALPRFAATSDLFELVGVLDGSTLSLYLDHARDNRPVPAAQLELDIGGATVAATRVADGEFQATLAAPLPEGETPITATVVAGEESDLLAGVLNLHAPADAHAGDSPRPGLRWALAGGVTAAVLALLWALRRRLGAGGAA